MTSQTLVQTLTSELSHSQALSAETLSQSVGSSSHHFVSQSLQDLSKLPYNPNHQVELLHLQAETEALLQQLRSLKQQRLTATAGIN